MPTLGEWIFIVLFSLALSLIAGYFDLGVGWRAKKRDKRPEDET